MRLKVNGEMKDTDASTLYDVIVSTGLDPSRVAAELNGRIVPRTDFKDTAVKENDSLELVHFVGGG